MSAVLVNGRVPHDASLAIACNDRGFTYGDGLFETALLCNGSVRLLEQHLLRLRSGCERLGIAYPDEQQLRSDIRTVCADARDGVLKVILTRGASGRGYRPAADSPATCVLTLNPLPDGASGLPVVLRWCETRLGRNAQLAGMKHLNRLEQVLAQREWTQPDIDEGLMLDTEGEVVCGTMSNVFIVSDAVLMTPDLRFCGVRGVMRDEVLRVAGELGIAVSESPMWPDDVLKASEVFVTNAVRGVRAVASLADKQWDAAPIADRIATVVNH